MKTETIGISEFKANCLKLVARVHKTRRPLIITKRGKPLATINVFQEEKPKPFYGSMKGKITILGDIVGPIFDEGDFQGDPLLY
jgi:antitoxin (DNA-binding transcriptional repressor) of toxin-antitoxin stability system